MFKRTFEDFLREELFEKKGVENFSITVLTNGGDNVGFYELMKTTCMASNRYRNSNFENFIYSMFPDKDDRRLIGLIKDHLVIETKNEGTAGKIDYKIIV